jgi:hypothetical protein
MTTIFDGARNILKSFQDNQAIDWITISSYKPDESDVSGFVVQNASIQAYIYGITGHVDKLSSTIRNDLMINPQSSYAMRVSWYSGWEADLMQGYRIYDGTNWYQIEDSGDAKTRGVYIDCLLNQVVL